MATPVQPSEAGFSTNLYLNNEKSGRVQFTFRGATSADWRVTLDNVKEFLAYMHEMGWKMDGELKVPTVDPAPTVNPEPTYVPVGEGGNELPEVKTFTADRLSVDVHDGKTYCKVIGKPFSKFGVPVWPEVLAAAGLTLDQGQPIPSVAGWRADYIEKDGKNGKTPDKVTRLLPPK